MITSLVRFKKEKKRSWSCGHSAYHHSETSLLGTIIGMAQNFVDTHHRAQFDNCIIALHSVTHEFRIMNGHIYVDAFSLLLNFHLWYILTPVRVNFIWRDVKANKLFIILIDQNREKLVAVVPQQMMRFIYGGNLLGGVFSLNHFQIEPTYAEYPSIVGKIVKGKRKYSRYFGLMPLTSFTLYLQDGPESIIKLKLYVTTQTRHQIVRTCYAIKRNYIIFVSRVKLVHLDTMNILIPTELTDVEFQSRMPEAFNIMNMPRRIFDSV
ncbi:unnamed protein product [Lactuca saligna]|uniref:Uncharacterized protein n=1 Tax=Lactuca saligna TaxID=75948 RepID=A0AA35Y1T7_LACSI|nr:unnamed protein product [Lactuca saligna]